jgi:hypothetical protein
MKVLALVSTLQLKYTMGCTLAWWQLFKALNENGHEVIVTPYLDEAIQSPWWRPYPNPCSRESVAYNSYLTFRKNHGQSPSQKTLVSPVSDFLIDNYVKPKWRKHVLRILEKERNVGCLLVMNVPMNHITGIPELVRSRFHIPVIFYDGDLPTSLPKYAVDRGFKFNYYANANPGEYDAVIGNSEGCLNELENMGARRAFALQYGIDAELASPVDMEKDIDISFFGYGSDFREEWMTKLITIPSREMPDLRFAVAGGGFRMDLGNAEMVGPLQFSEWRQFCCRSKISLNITRWSHTNVYASSTSRPFELAAFGACIVSQPYNGIEKWFDLGQEMLVVNDEHQAVAAFKRLLADESLRVEMGKKARQRVLSEHTFKHRAQELMDIIGQLAGHVGA